MNINKRVLVVDDNESILMDFRKLLTPPEPRPARLTDLEAELFDEEPVVNPTENFHYDLSFCIQSDEAFDTFMAAQQEGNPFSLVFTDVRMPPGTDGIRLIEQIWAEAPETEVVVMTAFSDYSWEDIINRFGSSDHLLILRKPFDAITVKQIALMLTQRWTSERLLRQQRDELAGLMAQNKEAEFKAARFREMLDQANESILVFDPDSERLVDVNQTTYNLLGYEESQLIGKGLAELFVYPINGSMSQQEQPVLTRENQMHTQGGEQIPVEYSLTRKPFAGRDYLLAVVRDIRARKRAQEEHNRLEAQLRHAQKMQTIGTLAGGIAHDFNNILSPILVYTEMAIEEIPSGRTRHDLQQVSKAAYRAKDLVEHILTFCNQMEKDRVPLNLQLIVKEAFHLVRASMPSTTRIHLDIDKSCGTVMADPTQIHQVIMNLCTNARHAIGDQGGTLEVALTEVELDKDTVRGYPGLITGTYSLLTVSDTGPGMTPEVLNRIFEPFFTTKKEGQGTGLGLSVVHGIVTSHKGDIQVESTPGKGTTFRVYLPIAEIKGQGKSNSEKAPEPGQERVLFVDDEEMVTSMMGELLTRLGYQVTTEVDSRKAFYRFQNEPQAFDIVITDQTMPHLTGTQLAERLLSIRVDLPIILCTGFSESITEERCKQLGISEFILKPIVSRDLVGAINRAMGNQSALKDR